MIICLDVKIKPPGPQPGNTGHVVEANLSRTYPGKIVRGREDVYHFNFSKLANNEVMNLGMVI